MIGAPDAAPIAIMRKQPFVTLACVAALSIWPATARCQETTMPSDSGQQAAAPTTPAPTQPTAPPAVVQEPPPEVERTRVLPAGRWVLTDEYGWIWVPTATSTTDVDGVPYVYLYTASYGWTWYVSPWGVGPYRYGVWVVHAWRPYGWRGGWVAGPHVVARFHARPAAVVHVAPRPIVVHGHPMGHRR